MTWKDVIREPRPRVVRQFGVLCLIFLGAVGAYQIFKAGRPTAGYSLIGLGIVCCVLGMLSPRVFRWVYTGAMVVVFPIGFVVSQVLLALLFFVVFLAVGGFLRLKRWDALRLRPRPKGESYWEPKPAPAHPSRYLRQY